MMKVRRATRDDIEAFSKVKDKPSLMAWVGEVDGEIVGLAGFALISGRWYGFCDLKDGARQYKVTLARTAIRAFAEARKRGIRFIYAEADKNEPSAVRWLTSLGFHVDPRSAYLYRWKA